MQRGYILIGHTGSYDDYRTWPVAIYLERAHADVHCAMAKEEASALLAEPQHRNAFHLVQATAFDPFFSAIDGQIGYSVQEVPFMGLASPPTDMRNWFAVISPAKVQEEAVLSAAEQAKAREMFLQSLPPLKSVKRKATAR